MTAEIISLAERRATVARSSDAPRDDDKSAEISRLLWKIARNLGIDGQGPFAYPPKIGPGGRER